MSLKILIVAGNNTRHLMHKGRLGLTGQDTACISTRADLFGYQAPTKIVYAEWVEDIDAIKELAAEHEIEEL